MPGLQRGFLLSKLCPPRPDLAGACGTRWAGGRGSFCSHILDLNLLIRPWGLGEAYLVSHHLAFWEKTPPPPHRPSQLRESRPSVPPTSNQPVAFIRMHTGPI